ncbi:hypothetical protein GCM10022295_92140 [Streptomyces osmaniensis]|uniref:Uncharacterized protein n=1 Tax=Streptomyces osmaniensis TaxID=593134 RepID=A0ABP6Z326_9ACTN
MVFALADVQAEIDVDAVVTGHVLAPVLVLFPALTCGISVPASTLRRDCLPLSGIGARASNQRSANAFDPGDTTFSIIVD